MRKERVYSLDEARVGYLPPARRAKPLPRASVRPGDPAWLHDGRTLQLPLRGREIDFFTVSIMCHALGRSSESVRRLIRRGVLPETRYRSPGRTQAGQRRLWTREQVLAVATTAEELQLRGRRPRRWADAELTARLAATAATA